MKKVVNLGTWNRRDHFHFFNRFEEPFFGVTVDVDCTRAYKIAKENGFSFFQYYLHKALVAANQIEPFKYRIVEDEVWEYDVVHASAVINRPDGTFGFCYIDFEDDFLKFSTLAKIEIEKVRNEEGLVPASSGDNVIHCSAMPWLNFKSLSHARSFSFKDSCPKFSFGQLREENERKLMPFSIHVNHALMDGYHVGQLVDTFQKLLNSRP
ncbi:MAG: chloramphenicol acetyltransferase [Pedobacter sp.]|nr:MAG: chloramphenicol acetyltransferase [Pedobacter sp.]